MGKYFDKVWIWHPIFFHISYRYALKAHHIANIDHFVEFYLHDKIKVVNRRKK